MWASFSVRAWFYNILTYWRVLLQKYIGYIRLLNLSVLSL